MGFDAVRYPATGRTAAVIDWSTRSLAATARWFTSLLAVFHSRCPSTGGAHPTLHLPWLLPYDVRPTLRLGFIASVFSLVRWIVEMGAPESARNVQCPSPATSLSTLCPASRRVHSRTSLTAPIPSLRTSLVAYLLLERQSQMATNTIGIRQQRRGRRHDQHQHRPDETYCK